MHRFTILSFCCLTLGSLAQGPPFRLQLLHFSDADGDEEMSMANLDPFSALVAQFRSEFPENTLLVSSGDNYLTGIRYDVSGREEMAPLLGVPAPGRAYMAILNALGVHASAVGNHELDKGLGEFAHIISPESLGESSWPGVRFPYLSANIDFSTNNETKPLVATGGQDIHNVSHRLAPSAIVMLGRERVGLVGAASPEFAHITGQGKLVVALRLFDPTDGESLDHLARVIQKEVDVLRNRGINKIVLLSHMQLLSVERALANRLKGVDIIVGGGSGTLMADADDLLREGDRALHNYPLVFQSPEGEPTLVVNTGPDYSYLGRLVVDFDPGGKILNPLKLDSSLKGSYSVSNLPEGARPMPEILAIIEALEGVVSKKKKETEVVGHSLVALEGRNSFVRTEETNLGGLVADSLLAAARSLDPGVQVALVNGGGIRTSHPSGPITRLDIENILRFNNEMVLVPLRAVELVGILEHTVALAGESKDPAGRFSQVAGLKFSFNTRRGALSWQDPSNCGNEINPGLGSISRIRDLQVGDTVVVQDGLLKVDTEKIFSVATLDFLATGGDGFPYPCTQDAASIRLTGLRQQDILTDYLRANFLEKPFAIPEQGASQDERIRNLTQILP